MKHTNQCVFLAVLKHTQSVDLSRFCATFDAKRSEGVSRKWTDQVI